MSDEATDQPNLSEPVVITTAFCNGIEIELTDGHIRMVGWENLPAMKERRVVLRAILTKGAADSLLAQLRKLRKGGEH